VITSKYNTHKECGGVEEIAENEWTSKRTRKRAKSLAACKKQTVEGGSERDAWSRLEKGDERKKHDPHLILAIAPDAHGGKISTLPSPV